MEEEPGRDLQQASVFYTVLGDADQAAHTAKLLTVNTGKLRTLVGKHLGIRLTPSLEFVADALPDAAAHIEELLQAARAKDAQVAASAQGASYAGDADPYKHAEDEEQAAEEAGLPQRADA